MMLKVDRSALMTAPSPAVMAETRRALDGAGLPESVATAIMGMADQNTPSKLVPAARHAMQTIKAAASMVDPTTAEQVAADAVCTLLADPKMTASPADFEAGAQEAANRLYSIRATADLAPNSRAHVGYSYDGGDGMRARMVAGLTKRIDPASADRTYNGPGMDISEIAFACAQAAGMRPWSKDEAVRMMTGGAHSTSDFTFILDGSIANIVARRLEIAQPAILAAASVMDRDDYRQGRALQLSATSEPREVREGAEITFVTADDKGELLPAIRDFGAGFNITNQAMANDATAAGLLNDIARRMSDGAITMQRKVVLQPLVANSGAGQTMADGKALFHVDHGNLAASGAVLSVTSLSAARRAMRRQMGSRGEILAVEPWALVVPPELETVAQQLIAEIAASTVSDVNPFSGRLGLIVEPGLTSPTAWYVCANPAQYDGLVVAYLEGRRSPSIQSRPAWETLGMQFRLVWSLDAKFIEWATWYRNPGA
jgi:hypothetical protein